MPEALVFTDMRRRIQKVNPAFVRIFGYESEDVVGRRTDFLYDSPQAFAEQGRMYYSDSAIPSLEPYEVVYRRRDGGTFIGETVGGTIRSKRRAGAGGARARSRRDGAPTARGRSGAGEEDGGRRNARRWSGARHQQHVERESSATARSRMLKAGVFRVRCNRISGRSSPRPSVRGTSPSGCSALPGNSRSLPRILDFNMVIEGMLAMLRRLDRGERGTSTGCQESGCGS